MLEMHASTAAAGSLKSPHGEADNLLFLGAMRDIAHDASNRP